MAPLAGDISEILPDLFIGTKYSARATGLLAERGISHILNVRESSRSPDEGPIQFCHVPLSDYGDTELRSALEKCFIFLDSCRQQGGRALVHCALGSNRSPTVVIAYLMYAERWNLAESYRHVLERRPETCPHENYFHFLKDYDLELFGSNSLLSADENLQEHQRRLRQE